MSETYRAYVKLPEAVADFFAALTGPGEVKYDGGDSFTFTFEVDGDLWEAAQVAHDVERQTASQGHRFAVSIGKPHKIGTNSQVSR